MSGAVGDFLFGSPGTASQVVDTTPDAFANLRPSIAGGLESQIQGGSQFQGPFTASLGPREQTLLDQAFGQTQAQPGTQTAINTLQQTAGGSMDPAQNPFLQAQIETAQRPILEQFNEQITPAMRARFTQAGQQVQGEGSSPFQMAAARAQSGLANALGDVGTQVVGQERQRQQQAAMALPGIERTQLETVLQGLEAQALPRLVEQFGIDRGLEEFRRREQQLMQALQLASGVAQPAPVMLPGQQATPGLVQQGLGAFAGGIGGGIGGALFGGGDE